MVNAPNDRCRHISMFASGKGGRRGLIEGDESVQLLIVKSVDWSLIDSIANRIN